MMHLCQIKADVRLHTEQIPKCTSRYLCPVVSDAAVVVYINIVVIETSSIDSNTICHHPADLDQMRNQF